MSYCSQLLLLLLFIIIIFNFVIILLHGFPFNINILKKVIMPFSLVVNGFVEPVPCAVPMIAIPCKVSMFICPGI